MVKTSFFQLSGIAGEKRNFEKYWQHNAPIAFSFAPLPAAIPRLGHYVVVVLAFKNGTLTTRLGKGKVSL
ncbi:hypothetical protein LSM04_008451 [Trypanosoma melophagium]|uniref:uncharacterized protein n=1 Tax=Trypanosoma melophagium TaxID=715481 RepID=UPI00351A6509|nr:hypothetical protein LSM04_008451 [Trypanosoma melophagium]